MKSALSANLRKARRARDLTQQQVADALGVAKQTISDQERGAATPNPANLTALARLYGVTEAELRYGNDGGLARGIIDAAIEVQKMTPAELREALVPLPAPSRIKPKIEQGYKITVFDIKTGEIVVDMSVEERAAADAHEIIGQIIKSDMKEKRRRRLKLED